MKKIDWNIQGTFLLVTIILATSFLNAEEILLADDLRPAPGPQSEESEAGSSLTIPKRLPPNSEIPSEAETPNPAHVQIEKKEYPVPHVVTTRISPEHYPGEDQRFQTPVTINNPYVITPAELQAGQKIDAVNIYLRRANGETTSLFDKLIPVKTVTWSPQGKITKLILMGDPQLQRQLARIPHESLLFGLIGLDNHQGNSPPDPQHVPDAESLLKWAVAMRREQDRHDAGDVILSSEDSRRLLIDPQKLELHENYVLNPNPLDSAGWRASFAALQSVGEGTRRSKLLRVFLEDPQPEERITLQGHKSIKIFYRSNEIQNSTADGIYHKISPGQYSGYNYFSRDSGSLKIASAYHLPATIELPPPEEEVGVFGEVMLLRPEWHERSTILVTLTDADGQPVKDWHFSYGPITFGGPYGYTKALSDQGMAIVEGLALQSFQVGFSEKPLAKFRSKVELKPGHLTRIAFRRDTNGELLEPNVSHYPWNDVTKNDVNESAAETE